MESNVTFEDNRIEVKEALDNQAIKFLYEAKDDIVEQTQRNTPVATHQLKESFGTDSFVDEAELIAYIGSCLEHSLWLERGTGEYAIGGKGRKGGWWIPVGNGEGEMPLKVANKYRWILEKRDSNGNLTFVFTRGIEPRKMLYKAYQTKKKTIQKRATEIYEELSKS